MKRLLTILPLLLVLAACDSGPVNLDPAPPSLGQIPAAVQAAMDSLSAADAASFTARKEPECSCQFNHWEVNATGEIHWSGYEYAEYYPVAYLIGSQNTIECASETQMGFVGLSSYVDPYAQDHICPEVA